MPTILALAAAIALALLGMSETPDDGGGGGGGSPPPLTGNGPPG